MSEPKPKRNPGKPTKYKPEYCEKLLEHMSEGLSIEAFAGLIRVHKDSIYEWVRVHPEFKEAKDIGESLSLLYWEKLGRDNIINVTERDSSGNTTSRNMNATTWIFNMKNRFRWRDKQPDENDNINVNLSLAERMAKARNRLKGDK